MASRGRLRAIQNQGDHMKKFSIFLLVVSASASAQTGPQVLNLVEKVMEPVFWNTIEEGSIYAKMIRRKSYCRSSPGPVPGSLSHECTLFYDRVDKNWTPYDRCEVTCDISFLSEASRPGVLKRDDRQVELCVENLYESC